MSIKITLIIVLWQLQKYLAETYLFSLLLFVHNTACSYFEYDFIRFHTISKFIRKTRAAIRSRLMNHDNLHIQLHLNSILAQYLLNRPNYDLNMCKSEMKFTDD